MAKSADKFYPTDNATLDLRTSCTKEEAAAKLIGWMKGHVRHDYSVDVDEDEITSDNLVYTHSLVYGLQEHLTILRNAEWNRYNEAVCEGLPEEVLKERALALAECDDLIRKVAVYLCDIDEELDKEFDSAGSSVLKIDRQATTEAGSLHITIRSLDKWAKEKYGISILDDGDLESATRTLLQIKVQKEGAAPSKEWGNTRSENFSVTFALLVDAFAKTAQCYRHDDARPNVHGIAKRLNELAIKSNINQDLKGQSAEAIKDRIEQSQKIKKLKLPVA